MEWLTNISWPGWGALLEILVLAVCFYYVFEFFRETPGAQVLTGLVLLLIVMMGLTQVFRLDALNWLLRRLSVYVAVALLIIFQPEIRRALAEVGRQHMFAAAREPRDLIDDVIQAVMLLAGQRVGALIAIERDMGTREIQETGVRLDSRLSPELLASIFYPHTPLHDGGVILRDSRILAAGCLFPLSQRADLSKVGMRHRAAGGLTEESDAVVVVVSEETGAISVSSNGKLSQGIDEERLRRFLASMLIRRPTIKSRWRRAREHLNMTLRGMAKAPENSEQEQRDGE